MVWGLTMGSRSFLQVVVGYGLLAGSISSFAFISGTTQQNSTQMLLSATKVVSMQEAVSGQQQANADKSAKQALATAIGAINMTDNMLKIYMDRMPDAGVPMDSRCNAATDRQGQIIQRNLSLLDIQDRMQSFASTRMQSFAEGERAKLDRHLTAYCSITEARAGLCVLLPNGLQSADVDYSRALGSEKLGDDGSMAALDYVAQVADVRFTQQLDCGSADCLHGQMNHLSNSSINSMVANSLVSQITAKQVVPIAGVAP